MPNTNEHLIETIKYKKIVFVLNGIQYMVILNKHEVASVVTSSGLVPDEQQRLSAISLAKIYLNDNEIELEHEEKCSDLKTKVERLLVFTEVEIEAPNDNDGRDDYNQGFTDAFEDIQVKLKSILKK
jgi:tRNA threonylcarbamoyladenosine modification (KEOPS) complex  Pcc1 subunit